MLNDLADSDLDDRLVIKIISRDVVAGSYSILPWGT